MKIAVLIPCFNEEKTIGMVVRDFRAELPTAEIYVYDNNSTDKTVAEAKDAGAVIGFEEKQGKGNVIRKMFSEIDADVYVMVDGDGTYPAGQVHELIKPIVQGKADMVIGSRLAGESKSRFKTLNLIGNRFFLSLLKFIFGVKIGDLLSGYRAFNRALVKGLPLLSKGFDIEAEMTVKSLQRGFRIAEIPVDLKERAPGSKSKISISRDGILILSTIFALFRDYKPLTVLGLAGLVLVICGFIPGFIVIREYFEYHYIYRVPSAILAVGFVISGIIVAFVGLIMHVIARRFQELDCQIQNINREISRRLD